MSKSNKNPIDINPSAPAEAGNPLPRFSRKNTTVVQVLTTLGVIFGGFFALQGVAKLINSVTRVSADVEVGVKASQEYVSDDSEPGERSFGDVSLPDGTSIKPTTEEFELSAWDSTLLEQFLSHLNDALLGVAILVAAVALYKVLNSIANGNPFDQANARWLMIAGVTLSVAMFVGPTFDAIAAGLVLDRVGLSGPELLTASADSELDLAFLIPLALLPIAAAFRRGAEVSEEVKGLV